MFKERITREELNLLPLKAFPGEIRVVKDLAHVKEACDYLMSQKLLGFDTETKPSFRKGRKNKMALIQLSSEDKAYLFRLNRIGFPQELIDVLCNDNITKIGLAIKDDIRGLMKYKSFSSKSFIDIQNIARAKGIINLGLKKLSGIVLGFRISKSQQLSNWEAADLSQGQKLYAATDAWIALEIYKSFKEFEEQAQEEKQ